MLMPDMLPLFTDRTPKAIQKKANSLGLQQKYPKFPDVDYYNRHHWTKEDEELLEREYSKYTKLEEIAKMMNMSASQVSDKAARLGLPDKYIRKNNIKFKAVYQDYDWCYERYVNRGMTHEQMAEEAHCEIRVMKKWCNEIHKIHQHTFKQLKTLTDLQKQIITFGTLGDGHIDKREDQPMYIESHCEEEKDYLFWKYDILKDLCNNPPTYHKAEYCDFGTDKKYLCQPFYRLTTRIIDELKEIRTMPRIEKIKNLNQLGFCLHILDDGSRNDLWNVCLAEWTQEEMDTYQQVCEQKFHIICKQNKDKRYYSFNAESSALIDKMILEQLPNDMDIIHKKILDNKNIRKLSNYRYVIVAGEKIGLSTYCRKNGILNDYEKIRKVFDSFHEKEVQENKLKTALGGIL